MAIPTAPALTTPADGGTYAQPLSISFAESTVATIPAPAPDLTWSDATSSAPPPVPDLSWSDADSSIPAPVPDLTWSDA